MTKVLLIVAAMAQIQFVPQPVPAPPASPGGERFARQRSDYEAQLRASCISEAGIRIIIEDWTRNRVAGFAAEPAWRGRQRQAAEAIYSEPMAMDALEAALRDEARQQAQHIVEQAEAGISVLRRLSPADRAIHARGFTVMRTATPVRTCAPRR